jgi:hypothetical protein
MKMSNETGYNGWKNYETWCVALWINNDQGTQETALEMARENKYRAFERYDLSHALKEWIEEMNPLNDSADLFTDLLNAALSEVDWYEIADSLFEDIKNEEVTGDDE